MSNENTKRDAKQEDAVTYPDATDEDAAPAVNTNAGNQYDNPNQEVVGTDIVSGGEDVQPVPEPEPETDDLEQQDRPSRGRRKAKDEGDE